MMKINDILNEIDKLNENIKKEKKESLRRNLQIDFKIKELEDERAKAGLRSDFSSVHMYNSKINSIKKKKTFNKISEYTKELKLSQKKLVAIIADYYKKGHEIGYIIEKEKIASDIADEWTGLSDFGINSGYLFVELVDEENVNWKYSNPVSGISFNTFTFDELKNKVNDNGEELFIFNHDLADKSDERDLEICRKIIDKKLCELDSLRFGYTKAKELLADMGPYADKFSGLQINLLCTIAVTNYQVYNSFICKDELMHLLHRNKEMIEPGLYRRVLIKNDLFEFLD